MHCEQPKHLGLLHLFVHGLSVLSMHQSSHDAPNWRRSPCATFAVAPCEVDVATWSICRASLVGLPCLLANMNSATWSSPAARLSRSAADRLRGCVLGFQPRPRGGRCGLDRGGGEGGSGEGESGDGGGGNGGRACADSEGEVEAGYGNGGSDGGCGRRGASLLLCTTPTTPSHTSPPKPSARRIWPWPCGGVHLS